MTLNLIRTGVGVQSLVHLREIMSSGVRRYRGREVSGDAVYVTTMNTPKQAEEILKGGGSLYWIVTRAIRARQKILGFESGKREDGKRFCHIILSPEVIPTQPYPHRHIQGWRYLKAGSTPPDIDAQTAESLSEMPKAMVAQLAKMGVV